MRDLLRLQETFEPQLRQTAHLFASDRWLALAELQSRLYRLAQWQAEGGRKWAICIRQSRISKSV